MESGAAETKLSSIRVYSVQDLFHFVPRKVDAIHAINASTNLLRDAPNDSPLTSSHRWEKPPSWFVALNCGGSILDHGVSAGCGGLCRNEEGQLIFAFTHKLEPCSIIEAEVWAIYHGICLTRNRGFRKILVLSDSKAVIEMLRGDVCPPPALHQLGRGTQQLNREPYSVRWQIITRKRNAPADVLAKQSASTLDVCVIYNSVPLFFLVKIA